MQNVDNLQSTLECLTTTGFFQHANERHFFQRLRSGNKF